MAQSELYHRLKKSVILCGDGLIQGGRRFLPLAAIDEAIAAASAADQQSWRHLFKPLSSLASSWHDLIGDHHDGQSGEPRRRVIGLLGLCNKEAAILDLLREGLTDKHFPFKKKEAEGHHDTLVSSQNKVFKSFSKWKDNEVDQFYDLQWQILAPEFTTRGEHISLADGNIPLPVHNIHHISTTGTSIVCSAQLHKAHLKPTAKHDRQVAIKFFYQDGGFEEEMHNLVKIQALNHPHLIRHIATVQQGAQCYAIFDWADGGDLSMFWERYPNAVPARPPELVLWCFKQMLGLVEALFALYELNYRHGDLKPGNILNFKDPGESDPTNKGFGRLVITDFGISKSHPQATELRHDGTNTIASTPDYEAPEAELDRNKPEHIRKPRSRKYDMWSVGCIFLEFIIWMLYGHKTIHDFRKIRCVFNTKGPYYIPIGRHVEAHPAVSRGLDALRKDPRCAKDTGLADLVNLIDNCLIVIEPGKRATAEEVKGKLEEIVEKAQTGLMMKRVGSPPRIPDAFRLPATVKDGDVMATNNGAMVLNL